MENTWNYVFSTIPQTLGTVIALSAMFVVYKINIIEQIIRQDFLPDMKRLLILINRINLDDRRRKILKENEIVKYLEKFKILKKDDKNLGLG